MWMSVANYLRLVRGNTILNSVNCPGSVSTSMLPPCCFTNNGHSWAGSSKALGEVRGLLLSVVGEDSNPEQIAAQVIALALSFSELY